MKRLKSTLAAVLLVLAGGVAIGLGVFVAIAVLAVGLVAAGAAPGARRRGPQVVDATFVDITPAAGRTPRRDIPVR